MLPGPTSQTRADEAMRPVPRFSGSGLKDNRQDAQRNSTQGLQWRTSSRVAPAKVEPVANEPMPVSEKAVSPVQPVVSQSVPPAAAPAQTTLRIVAEPSHHAKPVTPAQPSSPSVQQVRYQNARSADRMELAQAGNGFNLPPGLSPTGPTAQSPTPSPTPKAPVPATPMVPPAATPQKQPGLRDYFTDPFGDDAVETPPPATPTIPKPSVAPENSNGLRTSPPIEVEPQAMDESDEVMESDEVIEGETAGELLPPETDAPAPTAPNPFDRTRSQQSENSRGSTRNMEDFDLPPARGRQRESSPDYNAGSSADSEEIRRSFAFSCDDFRKSIAEATIQKVSLDISPPFRPDVIELDEFEKLKNKFDESQEVRQWNSIDGKKMGRGKLIDLAYEKVVIETEFGTQEELPINRISEADLAYLSKNWGLPQECLIEQAAYVPRNWQASTMTWKASNLCHKPLYFEEVNLERYGHTAGPFAQPIVSTAHFFVNIAVLPYKMGVHAPNECQYTLGYYRPGDCAPWIVPPVPISLRGGLYQAAAMTGAFWLIP